MKVITYKQGFCVDRGWILFNFAGQNVRHVCKYTKTYSVAAKELGKFIRGEYPFLMMARSTKYGAVIANGKFHRIERNFDRTNLLDIGIVTDTTYHKEYLELHFKDSGGYNFVSEDGEMIFSEDVDLIKIINDKNLLKNIGNKSGNVDIVIKTIDEQVDSIDIYLVADMKNEYLEIMVKCDRDGNCSLAEVQK